MKSYLFYFLGLFFLMNLSQGYGQCLENGDFLTNTCPDQSGPNCPTFSNSCFLNWHVANGTPQRLGTTDPYLLMWANYHYNGIGEGVFAGYNFTPSTPYSFKIRVQANGAAGGFDVYAASGLTDNPSSSTDCGSALQNIATKQRIGTFTPALNASWEEFDASFIANYGYTQLWISPWNTTNFQYNLYVDWVDICATNCASLTGTVPFNQGELPLDYAAGAIYVGSSASTGGSGTVTVNATASTTLIAGQNSDGIVFVPDFDATVSTGSFQAYIIEDCDTGVITKRKSFRLSANSNLPDVDEKAGARDSIARTTNQLNNSLNDKIAIYPVPSNGKITISNNIRNSNNSIVTVMDLSGKQILTRTTPANASQMTLNLSSLANGVYLLKINTTEKIITKKIIIHK